MEKINKKKISQLPEAETLNGFYALGTDNNNNSVRVSVDLLKGNKGDSGEKGEPGKDGTSGGIQIATDGDTISTDGEYLMVSEGTIILSNNIDAIPQSALSIVGALLPNGSFNSVSGYYHTPMTAIPSGKTKMLVTPMATNFGGRALAFYTGSGTFISVLPNADTNTPVLIDIPSNATQYILCRNTGSNYFAGFVSDGTKSYTNTDKIVYITVTNGAASITELRTLTHPEMLRLVDNGDTITTDGNYLFIEEGTAEFINKLAGETSEIEIPVNELNIDGYINEDGTFKGSGNYRRSDMRDIPTGASEFMIYSSGVGSASRPLAFYDSSGTFISSPMNEGEGTSIVVPRPANAAKYALGQNKSWTYGCRIKINGVQTTVENKDAIQVISRSGDVVDVKRLRDFSKTKAKIANRPKAFITDFLLNGTSITTNTINIIGTGATTASQLRYKAYMSTENIYFSVVFKANADSSIRVGRTDAGSIKIDGNILTTYSSNTTLYKTDTLPFSITAGNTYTVSCDKLDALRLRYTISSSTNESFSVIYDKTIDTGLTPTAWGIPFFGVINGDVTVKNAILSFTYDYNTQLSVFGDSFIEGNSLIALGINNKWSSLLGDNIGLQFVHVSGKGGEVASTAFVNRFKVENSLFKSPFVILAFGTNHCSLDSYIPYVQQLIDECRTNGQVPILQTIPPRSGINYTTVTKAINDWVKASGELYIDFHAALTTGDGSIWKSGYMMSDGTHPTIAGHLAMFGQVKRDLSFLIS